MLAAQWPWRNYAAINMSSPATGKSEADAERDGEGRGFFLRRGVVKRASMIFHGSFTVTAQNFTNARKAEKRQHSFSPL